MKKKWMVLIVCLLLAGVLSGCAKQEGKKEKEQTASKGRYVEQEIALPKGEEILDIIQNKEQQLELFTILYNKQEYTIEYKSYILQSNGQWEEKEASWLNKIYDEYIRKAGYEGMIEEVVQGEDSVYYARVGAYKEKESKSFLFRSSDGKEDLSSVELPYLDEKWNESGGYVLYNDVSDICVMENGKIALSNSKDNHFILFAKDGKEIETLDMTGRNNQIGNAAYAKGNELLGIKSGGSKLMVFDTEEHKEKQSIAIDWQENGSCVAKLDDGTILLVDKKGIHRLNEGGSLWETMVDGELNTMSMPTMYISRFFAEAGQQEEYYVLYRNEDRGAVLIHYVFDENVVTVPEEELTIYSLKENATVRQAIALFQREHQEVKVNYVVAMQDDETNSREYIKALNTELISGNGADILILDGLPAESYLRKGVLKDITAVCEEADILPNVRDAYRAEGKIYQMPLKIEVPLITGSKEAVDSAQSLADIVAFAKQHEEKSFVKGTPYRVAAEEFLKMERSSLITNNRLNTQAFGKFLEDIAYLKENGSVENGKEHPGFSSNAYYLKIGKTHADWDILTSISTLFVSQALQKEGDYQIGALENSFYANGRIAINQSTKRAEQAADFVRFILGDKVQETDVNDGFPISKKAWDTLVEKENKEMYFGIGYELEDGSQGSLDGAYPEKDIRERFAAIAAEVSRAVEPENILVDMIIAEMEGYFEGGKSAEQVVKSVESKINTYLTEQMD